MIETIFNCCEAMLWMAFAVVVAVRFHHSAGNVPRTARIMAVFFVLFAISDLVEMQTGAWWRPLGLLLLKGVCLIGLILCFLIMQRGLRANSALGQVDSKAGPAKAAGGE
ncbi:MAG: hypothetical protein JSS02_20630 [Planctomycetes bacterium]|nr:hypothetical protein [Planctomycetota bacterium]